MDVSIIRLVVVFVGIATCISVFGIPACTILGHETPQALVFIGSNGVTALVGILAAQRTATEKPPAHETKS